MTFAAIRIMSVVGPTATGKTKRALKIARKKLELGETSGVDLISVDSRQVYQGLEILTGADVPEGFDKKNQYFANVDEPIRIFGISIIHPKQEWSVAHFQQYARAIMLDSWKQNRLPILVGGTGLYHQELFRQDDALHVSPNANVRRQAEAMSLEELQNWLKKIDSARFDQMNHSDQSNSRRLIRAIEISITSRKSGKKSQEKSEAAIDIDWSDIKPEVIMVTAPLETIRKKIAKRVKERFKSGAIDEVKWLLSLDLSPSLPVFSTLGVPEISRYVNGELSTEQCQELWTLHEFQYAKRQVTWWKSHWK